MRATRNRLEEKFIIPIARELAKGLKAIHDAGIIHRDVKGQSTFNLPTHVTLQVIILHVDKYIHEESKLTHTYIHIAANVLIHEEGRLQICDFGVAGVLQSKVDKRSTWIGTPHWMPPEMFPNKREVHQYGSEVSSS